MIFRSINYTNLHFDAHIQASTNEVPRGTNFKTEFSRNRNGNVIVFNWP